MKTLAKKTIENVFNEATEEIRKGKKPSISKLMIKKGYSPSSARALTITRTKTWQELLEEIDDVIVLDMFKEIVKSKKDTRSRIAAGVELLKLKNRYPKEQTEIEAGEIKITIKKE